MKDNKEYADSINQIPLDFNNDNKLKKLLTDEEFINDIPYESRFVSIEMKTGKIMVTEIDDGISLIEMKKNNPDFITQVQRVTDDEIPDKIDNIAFLDNLTSLKDKKVIMLSLTSDKLAIESNSIISANEIKDIELSGEVSLDEDNEEPIQRKARKLKM